MCLPSATNLQRTGDGFGIGSRSAGDVRISFVASALLARCHVATLKRPAVFIAGRLRPCHCSPSCSPPSAEARSFGADNLQLWRVVCCHDLAETAAEAVGRRERQCEGLSMGSAAGRAAIRPVIDNRNPMPCTSSSPFIATLAPRALPGRARRETPDLLTPRRLPALTESRHCVPGNVLRPAAFL